MCIYFLCGRLGGLVMNALDSWARGLGSSPRWVIMRCDLWQGSWAFTVPHWIQDIVGYCWTLRGLILAGWPGEGWAGGGWGMGVAAWNWLGWPDGGGAWDLRSHPGRALILLVTETEVNCVSYRPYGFTRINFTCFVPTCRQCHQKLNGTCCLQFKRWNLSSTGQLRRMD